MISLRLDRERVATSHDVLMDGYTWFAGISFLHDALQLAEGLTKENPNAVIEVRKIYTQTQWIQIGECRRRPLCLTRTRENPK